MFNVKIVLLWLTHVHLGHNSDLGNIRQRYKFSTSLVSIKSNLLQNVLLLCLVKICSPHTCSFIYSTHESLSNLSCELQMKRQNNYYYKWYDKTTFLQGRGRRVGWKAIIVKSLIEMSFLLLRHTYISRKSWSEKKLLWRTTLIWRHTNLALFGPGTCYVIHTSYYLRPGTCS